MKTIVVLLSLIFTINGLTYDLGKKKFLDLGLKYNQSNPLIIGGSNAPVGFAPYMASLERSGNHICGGSILNSRWILTAGHCIIDADPIKKATVGTNKLNLDGIEYPVSASVRHELYARYRVQNDIGLVKTKIIMVFSALVKPVNLPTQDVGPEQTVVTLGWGRANASYDDYPNDLQLTYTKTLNETYCKSLFKPAGLDGYIYSASLCTHKLDTGSCLGDSGGPVVIDGVQHGIVSWGVGYNATVICDFNYPKVATRVFQYSSWIAATQIQYKCE